MTQQAFQKPRQQRRPVPGTMQFDRTNPFVYVGTPAGVRKAKMRKGSLIAPLDIDPELLRWPVEDNWVMVVTDPDQAEFGRRVAAMMIRDGALGVLVVSEQGPISRHIR